MTFELYHRVVLAKDLPEQAFAPATWGRSSNTYPARDAVPEAYELEFFAATRETIAVVSVPASSIREAKADEVLSIREVARA